MADHESGRDPVEELAEQFTREYREGRLPSIEDYVRRCPQHEAEIRDLFPALLVMEGLVLAAGDTLLASGDTLPGAAPLPESFGDYRIVRELGRGGMGVVYEAQQQSLDRRVALKVLPFHALGDAELRERFEREAHAAARLDHSHIVPVYEVGEHGGYPFFSMKLIDGPTLADKLAGGPLPPRETAQILLPVCRAIEAAHQRGVLHRDLKPSNILLDAEGEPQVTDFGLAKLFEAGSAVSETNAAAGTPSYMAPEQAQGDWPQIGVRTDVYGLGAILYHCLTARPPFQAATAAETMRQVATQEPVPLRQLNSSIDRDLETICLKCLAKEPAGRYPSAEAVADDLQRYLEGRPIQARPLSTVGRSIRWCRRKPMHAVSLLLLVLTCAVSVAAWMATEAARRQSVRSHQQTQKVVDFFLTRISEDELLDQPGMQPLRRDLLDKAREHYQRFVRERQGDPSLRAELADAYFRLGLVDAAIGRLGEARRQFESARGIQMELVRRQAGAEQLAALSKTLTALGELEMRRRKIDQARALLVEAHEIREKLVAQHPRIREYGRLLANATMHLGLLAQARAKFDEARDRFEQANQRRRTLLKLVDDADVRRDLGKGLYNLGVLEMEAARAAQDDGDAAAAEGRFAAAETALEQAVDVFRRLAEGDPQNPGHQYRLAECWRLMADVQARHLDEESGPRYEQALPELERLAYENPLVVDYQQALAAVTMNLGRWQFQQGRQDESLENFRAAEKRLELLTRLRPEEPQHRENLAIVLRSIGEIEALRGHYELARDSLQRARKRFYELSVELPAREDFQHHFEACGEALDRLDALMRESDVE